MIMTVKMADPLEEAKMDQEEREWGEILLQPCPKEKHDIS
jgi:hypothetical protein